MIARTLLRFVLALSIVGTSATAWAIENALAPVISRTDFTVRDPKFAKLVEKEVNQRNFQAKLSQSVSIPFTSVQRAIAKVSYKPDKKQGGTLVMWFEDQANKLTHDELRSLWKKIEAYIVHRFQGNSIKDSEVWVFGEAAAKK
jgi:hypothetical protein